MEEQHIATQDIQNVWSAAFFLIKKFWYVPAGALVFFVLGIYFALPLVPHLAFVVFLFSFLVAYGFSMTVFMKQFAKRHGFVYAKSGDTSTLSGRIFSIGNTKNMYHVVSGERGGRPLRFFHYTYTVGSGKNRTTYKHVVAEYRLQKTTFPFILLLSKNMSYTGTWDSSGVAHDIEVPLEPEFAKHFRLYTTQGYEIEALQIFTSEVLRALIEKGAGYSIEFSGSVWNLFTTKTIDTKKDIEDFFTGACFLCDTLTPLLERLHDDFAVLEERYKE